MSGTAPTCRLGLGVGERRLSVDEEDGSASLRVDFVSDFGRPAGVHHADAEYYVLEGELDVGGRLLGQGGYVHAGKGVLTPYMRAKAGTRSSTTASSATPASTKPTPTARTPRKS